MLETAWTEWNLEMMLVLIELELALYEPEHCDDLSSVLSAVPRADSFGWLSDYCGLSRKLH